MLGRLGSDRWKSGGYGPNLTIEAIRLLMYEKYKKQSNRFGAKPNVTFALQPFFRVLHQKLI